MADPQQVSCQFAVYPIGTAAPLGPAIAAALDAVRRHGIDVEAGPMSSMVTGPSDVVFGRFGSWWGVVT
ncbi:MAG: hypothetical protein ACLFRD_11680 [Nitriliruptoraceae bacterium]